jgi:protein-tyrosine phosphatase
MFGIFKKKKENSTSSIFDVVTTDMHSHILPGIDDGAQNVEESLALINVLYNKGIRKFICTPHIYKEMYNNTPEIIKAAYDSLIPHVNKIYKDVTIGFAAEYYMDDNFDDLLEKNEKLLTVWESHVLIEHGFVQVPPDVTTKIFNLQMAGYQPIYAHPERYEFFMQNKKGYHKLIDAGCIFQVNLLSLIGYYGKTAYELANYLVENKLVSLVGSDIHNDRHIAAFSQYQSNKLIDQLIQQNVLMNHNI